MDAALAGVLPAAPAAAVTPFDTGIFWCCPCSYCCYFSIAAVFLPAAPLPTQGLGRVPPTRLPGALASTAPTSIAYVDTSVGAAATALLLPLLAADADVTAALISPAVGQLYNLDRSVA